MFLNLYSINKKKACWRPFLEWFKNITRIFLHLIKAVEARTVIYEFDTCQTQHMCNTFCRTRLLLIVALQSIEPLLDRAWTSRVFNELLQLNKNVQTLTQRSWSWKIHSYDRRVIFPFANLTVESSFYRKEQMNNFLGQTKPAMVLRNLWKCR